MASIIPELSYSQALSSERLGIAYIEDFRPTQFDLGYIQAALTRVPELVKLLAEPKALDVYLRKHPLNVIIGPKGKIYLAGDKHHFLFELWLAHAPLCYYRVKANWSWASNKKFWKMMKAKKMVNLIDQTGTQREPQDLPRYIYQLRDDPYRSLAGLVRRAGEFNKDPTNFVEFLWARFFQKNLKTQDIARHFDDAMNEARILAHSEAAQNLPGYIKWGACSDLFTLP